MATRIRWLPRPLDVLLSAGCVMFSLVETLNPSADALVGGGWGLVLVSAAAVVLLFRRRWPLTVAVISSAVYAVAYGPPILILGLFSAGRYTGSVSRVSAIAAFAIVLDLAVWSTYPSIVPLSAELLYTVTFVVAAAAGGIVSWRYVAATHEREEALRAERERMVALARGEERERMAEEVRDVVAHKVSLMVVDAGALEVSAARGTGWVTQMAGRIRHTGQDALTELRQFAGTLGTGPAPLSPQLGIGDIEATVERLRGSGLSVGLRTAGEARTVPPMVERAAYRVVAEGCSNILIHQPHTHVEVVLSYEPDHLVVAVVHTNPRPRPRRDGAWLAALAERVSLVGGTFRTVRRPDRGLGIEATFPYRRTPS
ncbi:sensor histidine kinase [Nonomuraea soli]|uniref:histidine kinase n=1 Tax=Nonomuraea soli TaxID=1032476 RepID=A0A7W0HVD9_9ACTN|nr:histidine kinase [Nonomuraea soli]MBA2896711.1 signal transduction histidine kinase [Nonomuraea soli]